MRAALFAASILLLVHSGASHAALGGAPEQFDTQATTTVTSNVTGAGVSYTTRATTLAHE